MRLRTSVYTLILAALFHVYIVMCIPIKGREKSDNTSRLTSGEDENDSSPLLKLGEDENNNSPLSKSGDHENDNSSPLKSSEYENDNSHLLKQDGDENDIASLLKSGEDENDNSSLLKSGDDENDLPFIHSDPSKDSNVTRDKIELHNLTLFQGSAQALQLNSSATDDSKRKVHSIGHPNVKKEFPVALVTASALAAVFIITFICVAYYCHSRELDAMKKQMALELASERGSVAVETAPGCSSETEPLPVVQGHKNSIDVAEINDQQLLHYAGRRRSTFIF